MPADGTCVVVAYDGSPQADRALQAFQALGLAGEDEVHVVSIHADRATAERLAEQAVDFLKLHGVRAVPHPLDANDVRRQNHPRRRYKRVQAHLLVMGAIRPVDVAGVRVRLDRRRASWKRVQCRCFSAVEVCGWGTDMRASVAYWSGFKVESWE